MATGCAIEAVLFDLGETLLEFGAFDKRRLLNEALERSYRFLQSLRQPVGDFARYRRLHIWGLRWFLLRSWLFGRDFNSLELLKRYGQARGFNLTEPQWLELNWVWYEGLAQIGKSQPDPPAALERLSREGFKLGLLSNTFIHASSLERHLEREGLLRYLPVRMYSYEFSCRKPCRQIFLQAAQRLGVRPERVLYVGDLVVNDALGARRAGMQAALKTTDKNKRWRLPADVPRFERISQLADWVARQKEHYSKGTAGR